MIYELNDRVVALKDLQAYDTESFEPHVYVVSGTLGTVVSQRTAVIGDRTVDAFAVDFGEGGIFVWANSNDGFSFPDSSGSIEKI